MSDQDDGTSKGTDDSEEIGDFLQDMLRSLGRGASKARDFIAGLGEKGAAALSLHKLETERKRLLLDLGDLARRTLSEGESLAPNHQHAGDLMKNLDRIDEKIEKSDRLVNEIVYELYGLTDEEIETVEAALKEQ